MAALSKILNEKEVDKIFEKIKETLDDVDIISSNFDKDFSMMNSKIVDEIINKPCDLFIDEETDRVYYLKGEEKIFCEEGSNDGVEGQAIWLSTKLPSINFDILQEGNIRKRLECEAIYILSVLNAIFLKQFDDEIKDVYQNGNYDFDNMSPFKEGNYSFRDLLNDIKQYNSISINSVISSAQYKLSDFKDKKNGVIFSLMTEEERFACQSIDLLRVGIILKHDKLFAKLDKNCSKLDRLKAIQAREDEISAIFQNDDSLYKKFFNVYFITKINSKWLGSMDDVRISKACIKEALIIQKEYDCEEDYQFKTELISKLKRYAQRIKIKQIKIVEIGKYRRSFDSGSEEYILPSKKKV